MLNKTNLISLLSMLLGVIAFISGYVQYIKAQKWKRAEFVAKEIKEFEAKEKVKYALKMIDWNRAHYNINGEETIIDDKILQQALRKHDNLNSFNNTEIFIREAFDAYFISLERFNHYIESNLVSSQEFHPYLRYYLDIIGNKKNNRKSEDCRKAILDYLKIYDYTGVIKLLSKYGYYIN